MATTALQVNTKAVPGECYQKRLEQLTEVVISHSLRFHRIALRHLGNAADAEDAVQDAFLSALKHVDQFKAQAKMSTWLTAIVINSARMKLRRRPTHTHIALEESMGDQSLLLADLISDKRPDPEEVCRDRQVSETVARATSRLSPSLRRTYQLRDVEGLSIRETAELLGVPAGTVKARLARARRSLRQVMPKSFRERINFRR